jgi:hypothetical protein
MEKLPLTFMVLAEDVLPRLNVPPFWVKLPKILWVTPPVAILIVPPVISRSLKVQDGSDEIEPPANLTVLPVTV